MKTTQKKILLVAIAVTVCLCTSQSANAWCTISAYFIDHGGAHGHLGCYSSAGHYAFLDDGTDITDDFDPAGLDFICSVICPGGNPLKDDGGDLYLSKGLPKRYPQSYALARANVRARTRLTGRTDASPFVDGKKTVYDLVMGL
ncbi:MAG: hypothetical protein ACXW18_07305 [Pyrinomonadaceae bacterium]